MIEHITNIARQSSSDIILEKKITNLFNSIERLRNKNESLELTVTDFSQRQTDDHYLLINESHKVQDLELACHKISAEASANTEALKTKVETDHFIEELEYFRTAGIA